MSSALLWPPLLLACVAVACCRPAPAVVTASRALEYLSQYGYLPEASRQLTPEQLPQGALATAIADFQAFSGLNVTGVLDAETTQLMQTPRCGVKDVEPSQPGGRRRRFTMQGSKWRSKQLSYHVSQYSDRSLDKATVDQEFTRAFKVWSDVSPLVFTEKASGPVNIDIRFANKEHGDGQKFDGRGNTLAHAFFPSAGGDTHFDDDETFTTKTYRGTNLFQTAVHEFGHALGLSHSDIKSALMAPYYLGYQPNFQLHQDDIDGIQALYGTKNGSAPAVTARPGKSGKRNKALCKDPSVDAIFTLPDGSINVIKGRQHYQLAHGGVAPGYPKPVQKTWPELPAKVDAAFTYKGGYTFFFGDKKVWSYHESTLTSGFPVGIGKGFGASVPEEPDVVFEWSGNGKVYFFEGDQFWCFDPTKKPAVSASYPKPVSAWKGVPGSPDSALVVHGTTYFFKKGNFYKFDDDKFAVAKESPSYPRPSGPKWFGCKK